MKWRIEEVNTGSKSETSFIIVYPDADIGDLAACCAAMRSPNLNSIHVLVDKRTSVSQTQSCLGVISDALPDVQMTTRFAHPFVIGLVLYLWRQMRGYYDQIQNRKN